MSEYDELPSLHHSLDYSGQKEQTIRGTPIRHVMNAQKTTFKGDQEALMKIPSDMFYTFMNIPNMTLLEFEIVIPAGASLKLNREGAYGFFDYMDTGTQSSPSYSNVGSYNNLVATVMDLQCSQTYKGNTLALTAGTTSSNIGQELAAGTYKFSIPLINTALGMSNTMYPLFSREETSLRVGIATIQAWGIWTGTITEVVMQNVQLKADLVRLDKDSYDMVYEQCDGVFKIFTTGIMHSSEQIPVGSTQPQMTIPSQVNYIDKVLVTWRKTAAIGADTCFNSARVYPKLSSIQLKLGGQSYPTTAITGSSQNTTEFLCETLSTFNMLNNNNHASSLNAQGDGETLKCSITKEASLFNYNGGTDIPTTSAKSGSFCFAINMTALNNDSLAQFNGVSSMGQKMQIFPKFESMLYILTQDVYVFHSKVLTLDMNTDRVWKVED